MTTGLIHPPSLHVLDRSKPINRELVGYWFFKGSAHDLLYSDHGTIQNGGWLGNGFLSLDGAAGTRVELPPSRFRPASLDFTMSIYCRMPSTSGDAFFQYGNDSATPRQVRFYTFIGGAWQMIIDGDLSSAAPVGSAITDDTWKLLTFRRRGNTFNGFIGANLDIDNTTAVGSIDASADEAMTVGAEYSGLSSYTRTTPMDAAFAAVWHRALTDSEIFALARDPWISLRRPGVVLFVAAAGAPQTPAVVSINVVTSVPTVPLIADVTSITVSVATPTVKVVPSSVVITVSVATPIVPIVPDTVSVSVSVQSPLLLVVPTVATVAVTLGSPLAGTTTDISAQLVVLKTGVVTGQHEAVTPVKFKDTITPTAVDDSISLNE